MPYRLEPTARPPRRRRRRRDHRHFAFAVLAAVSAAPARAADVNWTATAGTGTWSTGALWNTGARPGGGDNAYLVWPAPASVDATVTYDLTDTPILNWLTLDALGTRGLTLAQTAANTTFRAQAEYVGMNGRGAYDQQAGNNYTGRLYVGYSGTATSTYALAGAARLQSDSTMVGVYGGAQAAFTQTGGDHATGALIMGFNSRGNTGTYNLSGGRLTANTQTVGTYGIGAFNHTGGTNQVAASLTLGMETVPGQPSAGTYSLGGTGDLIAPAVHVGYRGGGTFTQSGGSASVGTLYLATLDGSTAAYNFTGGRLNVSSSVIVGNANGSAAFFHHTGGGTVRTGGIIVNKGGTYTQDSGNVLVNNSLVVDGGTVELGFWANVGVGVPASASGAALGGGITVGYDRTAGSLELKNGAKVRAVIGGIGMWTTGTATATFTGAGTTFTADQSFRVGASGPGTLVASAGATINCWDGYVGSYPDSAGYAVVNGAAWNCKGGFYVAGQFNGPTAAPCTLNLDNGAALNAGTFVQVWNKGTINVRTGAQVNATSLVLRGGGDVILHAGAKTVLDVQAITIEAANGSRLDLGDNALVVNYAAGGTAAATVKQLIQAGRNGGTWTGDGITSGLAAANPARYALGFGEASAVLGLAGPATARWMGRTVDASSILVRYTLLGDATLDGVVDFNDLVKLAQNYNATDGSRAWTSGDFTYDGVVDFNDLVKLAQNYNASLPPAGVPGAGAPFNAAWAAALAQVPEPSLLPLAAAAGTLLAPRRRRRGQAR